MQQIETQIDDGRVALRDRKFLRTFGLRPVLHGVERRSPVLVQRHDLTVENHRVDVLLFELRDDFRKQRRQIEPATRLQKNRVVLDVGDDAIAIELRFVHPVCVRARFVARIRQHG